MRINRIELKNFRNHRDAAFDFERGINLVLGENGSGKTSILDAAGFALFNMKLRSDSSETLTMNESSGYVKVVFTGNDENVYVVTRKFPASSVSLSEEGSKINITGVAEVYHKINSLIGNSTENPALFENVIVASQNKFTLIFDATPSEREAVFNPVFGTEIYRQMYNGVLKKSCDIYDKQLVFAGGEIESARSQLKDSKELSAAREEAGKKYLAASETCNLTGKKIEDSEKAIRDTESLKNRKEKLSIAIRGLVSQIDDKKKLVESIAAELRTAEAAALEEIKLKPDHDEYEKIKLSREKISGEINELERTEKEYFANKNEIAKREKEIATSDGNRRTLIQQLESNDASAAALRVEIGSISAAVDILEKEKLSSEAELSSLMIRKSQFDDLHKKHKDSSENASRKALLAAKAEETAIDEKTLNDEIEKLESGYTELEILRTKRDNLRAGMTRYKTLLTGLEEAERELSKQVCPYLKERCSNIENEGSLYGYFNPKKNEINVKISDLEKEAALYNDLDERINKCSSSRSAKNEQLASLRKNMQDAVNYRKDESVFKLKTAKYALEITKLFSGLSGKETFFIMSDDYNGAAAVMQGAEAEYVTRLAGIAGSLREKQDEYKKKENDLAETERINKTALNRLREIEKEISDFNIDLNNRVESSRVYERKLEPLDGMKKKYAEYAAVFKNLEPADQKYRSAVQAAARKDGLLNRLESEQPLLEGLILKQKSTTEEHDSIIYNVENHNKLVSVYNGLRSELKEQNEVLMNFKSAFDIAVQAEENNNRLSLELAEKIKQIDLLARKKEIADKFREDIKQLGPYISERRTRMIAAAASDNYQRMTGRAERILWENNPEQYLVSVSSVNGKRRFNMLSGGEQVAVALSIRSALASEMTDCRFAIFDEPTINLDAEKKEALSVSLYDMLKNLEQALVVTHDDTFREMAANIIELGRG